MIKRSADIAFSSVALLVLLPLIGLLSLAVWAEDRRNPLYSHIRYGKDMSFFTLFKIRTMDVPAPNENRKIEDKKRDRRVTKVGKFLRAFHLDELPQLWNILKGDMSFVGPRPIPVGLTVDGIPNWDQRSVIRPGLTGMAQLYCTKYTTLARKFHFDVLYVEKKSLWLDIKLMAITSKMIMSLVAFAACNAGILLATLLPISEENIPGTAGTGGLLWQADKFAHFGMFMVWAIAAYWFGRGFLSHYKVLSAICFFGMLLAGGTEIAQLLVPLRNMSPTDYVADMVGVLYVVALILIGRKTGLCKKES